VRVATPARLIKPWTAKREGAVRANERHEPAKPHQVFSGPASGMAGASGADLAAGLFGKGARSCAA
jgi:hypothetical protein